VGLLVVGGVVVDGLDGAVVGVDEIGAGLGVTWW
jgi:hypothetical protein